MAKVTTNRNILKKWLFIFVIIHSVWSHFYVVSKWCWQDVSGKVLTKLNPKIAYIWKIKHRSACWQKWERLCCYSISLPTKNIVITRSSFTSGVRHPDDRRPKWKTLEWACSVTVLLVGNSEWMISARSIFSVL